MTGCWEGAGKVLPGMTSTETTDSPETPDTLPLMVPALAARVRAATTAAIQRVRTMVCVSPFEIGREAGTTRPAMNQYTNSTPATAELVRKGLVNAVFVPGA